MIRDIVFLALLVVMTLAVLLIYVKVSKVMNMVRRTLEDIEGVVSTVSEKLVAPAAAGSGLAFGAGKVAAFLFGTRRSKKTKEED